METNIQDLLNKYEEIYLSRSRDFNALTTVHLSENDHTNILREILNMKVDGKKPFMKSFVRDVLGIDYKECYKLVAKTQIASIGNNEKGFIDLLIEGDDIKIVIENKVCGAVDMPYQLSRYYFSFVYEENILGKYFSTNEDKVFIEQCKYWHGNNRRISKDKVYIVYLSETADKIPDKKSIPESMRDDLSNDKHYIPISYEKHIYDWLNINVLPHVPFGTGNAHMSIILYLRELENILVSNAAQNQWYLETGKSFIDEIYKARNAETNIEKYKILDAICNDLTQAANQKAYEDNSILRDLRSCVLCWRNNVFGQFAPEGWTAYCDGTYIKFYPTRWKEKYGGSTACNIHFLFNNWQKKNVTIFDFNIHSDACKKYIITMNKKEYKSFYNKISSHTKGWNKVDDQIEDKSTIKKNQWHLRFDTNKKKVEWMPNDNEAITTFFRELVESNEIQKLVKYIDDNFK